MQQRRKHHAGSDVKLVPLPAIITRQISSPTPVFPHAGGLDSSATCACEASRARWQQTPEQAADACLLPTA